MTGPKHGHAVVDGFNGALHVNSEFGEEVALLTSQLHCHLYLSWFGKPCQVIQTIAILT